MLNYIIRKLYKTNEKKSILVSFVFDKKYREARVLQALLEPTDNKKTRTNYTKIVIDSIEKLFIMVILTGFFVSLINYVNNNTINFNENTALSLLASLLILGIGQIISLFMYFLITQGNSNNCYIYFPLKTYVITLLLLISISLNSQSFNFLDFTITNGYKLNNLFFFISSLIPLIISIFISSLKKYENI